MAFLQSYTQPGVYTQVITQNAGVPLFGDTRIPILIGEGQEVFTQNNVEMHRGSSAVQDDKVVNENISNQVNGVTRSFQLTYFPVVVGDGTGTITNDYRNIQVLANNIPVTVISLNGTTGVFQTQQIIPSGTNVVVNYNFKRRDTQVINEDLSAQIPSFASLALQTGIVLGVTNPGILGNNVNVAVTLSNTATVFNSSVAANVATVGATGIGSFSTSTPVILSGLTHVTAANGTFTPSRVNNAVNTVTAVALTTNVVTVTAANSLQVGDFVALNITSPVTNVALTANVATLTAVNNYAVGDTVTVSGLTNTLFNGTWTVTGSTGTTFTFALTHANVGTVADSGVAAWNTLNGTAPVAVTGATGTNFTYALTHANITSTVQGGTATGANFNFALTTANVSAGAETGSASGPGVVDTLAITGAGTDTISIEAKKSDGTVRTLANLQTLLANTTISTLSAGNLAVNSLAAA
jgi:hypothetical protein